jgi:hypothetical protein
MNLVKLNKLRSERREIFYVDETWTDSNLIFKKSWQTAEVKGVLADGNAENRLIVVHAGSEDGFVAGSKLIYKAGSVIGDYHGQMNNTNFEEWMQGKLIPNLPEKSVVVFGNTPYHCIQVDKPPSKYAVKADMISRLRGQGIYCDASIRKHKL